MYQTFLIQIAFQSSERVELDFRCFVIKMALNFKSRGTETIQTLIPRDLQISNVGTLNSHC